MSLPVSNVYYIFLVIYVLHLLVEMTSFYVYILFWYILYLISLRHHNSTAILHHIIKFLFFQQLYFTKYTTGTIMVTQYIHLD